MDDYKRQQMREIGPGGFNCGCCNDYEHKHKPKLNRHARSRLKMNDIKMLKNIESEDEMTMYKITVTEKTKIEHTIIEDSMAICILKAQILVNNIIAKTGERPVMTDPEAI